MRATGSPLNIKNAFCFTLKALFAINFVLTRYVILRLIGWHHVTVHGREGGGDNFLQTTIRVLNAFRRQKTSGTTASVCIFCVFCCNGNEFCSLSVRSSTSPRFRKNILLKSFEALTFVFQISFSMSEILCFYQIWNTVTCFAYNLNNLVGVFWSCRMRVIPER